MPDAVKVGFVPFSTAPRGILVVFCDDTLKFGAATRKALGDATDLVGRAAATNQFKGKSGSTLDILAPEGLKASRLIVVGAGKLSAIKDYDFLKLGGAVAGKLRAGNDAVTIIAELPAGAMKPDQVAAVASGVRLEAVEALRYGHEEDLNDDERLLVGYIRQVVTGTVDDETFAALLNQYPSLAHSSGTGPTRALISGNDYTLNAPLILNGFKGHDHLNGGAIGA